MFLFRQKSYKEVAQLTVCTSPSSSSFTSSMGELGSPSTAPSTSSTPSSSTPSSSTPSTSTSPSYPSLGSGLPVAAPPAKDLLRLLLPALCHLTAEDEPRKILRENKGLELLLEYFAYHWRMVNELKRKESEVGIIFCFLIFKTKVF